MNATTGISFTFYLLNAPNAFAGNLITLTMFNVGISASVKLKSSNFGFSTVGVVGVVAVGLGVVVGVVAVGLGVVVGVVVVGLGVVVGVVVVGLGVVVGVVVTGSDVVVTGSDVVVTGSDAVVGVVTSANTVGTPPHKMQLIATERIVLFVIMMTSLLYRLRTIFFDK